MKGNSSFKRCVAFMSGALLLVVSFIAVKGQVAPGGEVHGSVYALIRGQESFPKEKFFINPNIFVPDVSVYLENVKIAAASASVTTDLDGTFMIPTQPQAEDDRQH